MSETMTSKVLIGDVCDFFCRYHCLWIAGAFALGIIVHQEGFLNLYTALFGCVIAVMCCGIFWKRNRIFFIFMVTAFFFSGALHCQAVLFLPQGHIYHVFLRDRQKTVSVSGQVIGDVKVHVDKRPYLTFYFDVDELFYSKHFSCLVQGRILVRSFVKADVQIGNRLKVFGKMHLPYDFQMGTRGSYKAYLRQNGIYVILTVGKEAGSIEKMEGRSPPGVFIRIREGMKKILNRYLPEFESGILRAVLTGDRTGLASETRQLFVQTGTAHVLAISGLHMGIMMGIFLICVGVIPAGFRLKYFFVGVLMAVYMPLAGWRPSVIRSGVMAGMFLFALSSERRFCSLNILGLAGFVILIARPLDLYTAGFQLSFSATLSLIIFFDCFYQLFQKGGFPVAEWMVRSFSVSLAAWLGVAGLVLYHFGTLTPIGIFANLCVVGLVAVVIVLGLMLIGFGLLQVDLCSQMVAMDIQIVVHILMRFVSGLSRIPFGHFENIFISGRVCVLYYAFFIVTAGMVSWQKARKPSDMRGLP